MKKLFFILAAAALLGSCSKSNVISVHSPDKNITTTISTNENGAITYFVQADGKSIILPSQLGFEFKDHPPFKDNFEIKEVRKLRFSQEWEQPWGEDRLVKNEYNEAAVTFQEKSDLKRQLRIVFRAFDDGVAFRYEFPKQPNMKGEITILDELTEFQLAGNHQVWWQPGDWDIYEHLYKTTRFSKINALKYQNHNNLAQTYIPENAVNTPVTMKSDLGHYISFHEANLTNYAGMTLKIDTEKLMMTSELVGRPDGAKVTRKIPFPTPWRTVQIVNRAGALIESKMILNLNESNVVGDMSWFTPTKYAGIWWDMHIGTKSWDMASGRHGATTKYAMEMIDFAAENNIGAVLVEGWNTGWEHWIGFEDREGVFDFITPYPDYDLEKVVAYGKSKGVDLIMHHETSAAPRTYEAQLDTAFSLMKRLGIHAVKTGYVGKIIPKGEYHHGQWMVNHYRKVTETAAKYQIAVNIHEPIKDTGIRRTYPNEITREGLRGQEFNAWASDGGNPPEHLPIVAFTRMLAGPIDYTPGIFNIKLKPYKPDNQVNTTLAHQLAFYVVIYSPIQMVPDLPKYYRGHPAMQFIRDVAVDWEKSLVLDGEIGDYVMIARQERNGKRWFVGAITDENERELELDFSFLPKGDDYQAFFYLDGPNAHWNDHPTDYEIKEYTVNSSTTHTLKLAAGGGAAISLFKINE
jgi:glucan 1,4-alpha-glucosidase